MSQKKLFLLDGMALVYRAHFALIRNPIKTSKGKNTSAVFGFMNTLLNLLETEQPTHLAVAFDTSDDTKRHKEFPDYKAQREALPEDIEAAFPYIDQILKAMHIPALRYPGYEADDIIGTLARSAEKEGFTTYMVTPDKDFAQLVDEHTFMFKPARKGATFEVLGVPEVLEAWGIERIEQVVDILGLWGDSVDNIPGVPGIGEKTSKKLIAKFGSLEELVANSDLLKGKQRENIEKFGEQAQLSKRLATIQCDVPVKETVENLALRIDREEDLLRQVFIDLEFNSLGKRMFGDDFVAGRGHTDAGSRQEAQQDLFGAAENLRTIADVPHDYRLMRSESDCQKLATELDGCTSFCFDTETTSLDPKQAQLVGVAFSWNAGTGAYVAIPEDKKKAKSMIECFRPAFENESKEKVGHNLKYDINILSESGIQVKGPLFDTMIAHALIDSVQRHNLDYLSEAYLGYSPISITTLIGEKGSEQKSMRDIPVEQLVDYACEDADLTWQLKEKLEPQIKENNQATVFYEIEMPLIPVLARMEREGITLDPAALLGISEQLGTRSADLEKKIYELAGTTFNLNSPKQLGQILFDFLKLEEKPKKTKTGQYATNEQVLSRLARKHEVAELILQYRETVKLKNTYVDTLPEHRVAKTGRIHTTFGQVQTATGRIQSQYPNLQNIPIRSEQGREIRRAFIPRGPDYLLMSADYSQIELRIIAELSHDTAMSAAFQSKQDIHTATAAHVYGIDPSNVDGDMRRKAKMVNYGLAYGMSAFGLSQRLGISRKEASDIIKQYFHQFPGIKNYIDAAIGLARERGYAETISGRRRYLPDIDSRNGTIRAGAERNAINMPIQGTAADLIKTAMVKVDKSLSRNGLSSRLLLQVHDELVLDVYRDEVASVEELVHNGMVNAMDFKVPLEVEIGTGSTWLDAH